MASLEDVKFIDATSKIIVFGFMREAQCVLPTGNIYYTIPVLVSHWCLLYFTMQESFDPDCHHGKLKLKEDNSIVTVHETGDGFAAITAYLKKIVKSGVHQWEFKILHDDGWTIDIGIWKVDRYPENVDVSLYSDATKYKSYAYTVSHRCRTHPDGNDKTSYGKKCVTGDIICMIVDLEALELRYMVNNEDFGVCNKIEKTSYKAAISLYHEHDALELISYKQIKQSK